MREVWNDMKHAARVLRKKLLFTVVAVLTLGLGIGANISIFGVINGVLLHPLPYKDANRLVVLFQSYPPKGMDRMEVSPPNYVDWRLQSRSFEDMAAAQMRTFLVQGAGETVKVRGMHASSSLFRVLGLQAVRGTLPTSEDTATVVLSQGFWQRAFGGDPAVVGQRVSLSGMAYTVTGIVGDDLHSMLRTPIDVFVPLNFTVEELSDASRSARSLLVLARLHKNVSISAAAGEMKVLARQLAQQYPISNANWTATVTPVKDLIGLDTGPALWVLLITAIIVLLIAIANVLHLLLAHMTSRRGEFGVRAALGASRRRLIQQVLVESLLIAAMGAAAGLFFSVWGADSIVLLGTEAMPWLQSRHDAMTLLFAAILSCLVGVACGVVPALQASRININQAQKEIGTRGNTSSERSVFRRMLVVSEVGLAVVLLTVSLATFRNLLDLYHSDLGIKRDHLLTMRVDLPDMYTDPQKQRTFYEQLLPAVAGVPGVVSTAVADGLPLAGGGRMMFLTLPGDSAIVSADRPSVDNRAVSPQYFSTLGIELKRGRMFTEGDVEGTMPVAVINQACARQLPSGVDALGQLISLEPAHSSGGKKSPKQFQIIGVVGDVREHAPIERLVPIVFVPYRQEPRRAVTLAIRTTGDPDSYSRVVRQLVSNIDGNAVVSDVRSMDERFSAAMASRRFTVLLLGVFAGLAAALATIGIYAVITHSVTERTKEIGVRMAIGAERADILKMVMTSGLRLALLGLVGGAAAASALLRLLRSQMRDWIHQRYLGAGSADTDTLLIIGTLVIIVVLCATYFPARRASRTEPLDALRSE